MCALFVVLAFNVDVKGFNIVWLGVTAVLVQCQVVVSEFSFKLTHVFDQGLVLALQSDISLVVLVYSIYFVLHLVDLGGNLVVLVFKEVEVVVAIVHLATDPDSSRGDTRQTVVGHRSVNRADFGVITHARVVDFTFCRRGHAHSGRNSSSLHFKFKFYKLYKILIS